MCVDHNHIIVNFELMTQQALQMKTPLTRKDISMKVMTTKVMIHGKKNSIKWFRASLNINSPTVSKNGIYSVLDKMG